MVVPFNSGVQNFRFQVIDACNITGVHFYAGSAQLPLKKQGKLVSSPGQPGFNLGLLNNVKEYSCSITISGTGGIYVSALADVILK